MLDLTIDSLEIYQMSTKALKTKISRLEFQIESGEIEEDRVDEAEELITALQDELAMREE